MQTDLPFAAAHQPVGIAELELAGAHRHLLFDRSRVLADQRVLAGFAHQQGQVNSARLVAARQPRRFDVMRVLHAQRSGLAVHGSNEGRQPPGVMAPERVGGAVLAGHQGQMKHLLA